MTSAAWHIRLGQEAESDFTRILAYTNNVFGRRQADLYRDILIRALAQLAAGPDMLGTIARDDILPGLRTLHIARHGRRGRHFILYRAEPEKVISVLRILHDAMDFKRNLP